VQNTAAHHDLGAATSSVSFARQIGSSIGVALIGALFIHRLDGQLDAHLPASGPGHLSAAQVSSITPQGLGHLAPPFRHIIAAAFTEALPPIYAYLIPLLAVAFVLALILREIPLHTHARQDAARSDPPTSRHARGRRSHHARPVPITGRAHGDYMRALSAGACQRVAYAAATMTRPPGEPRSSTIRVSR
jgi:hypothetical protein